MGLGSRRRVFPGSVLIVLAGVSARMGCLSIGQTDGTPGAVEAAGGLD